MDSIPGTALALMPIPLMIEDSAKARKLPTRPSQRICVRDSCPGLNKIPFQVVQLFANHKPTPTLAALNGNKKATCVTPRFRYLLRDKRKPYVGCTQPLPLRSYFMSSFLVSVAVGRFTSVM